MPTNCYANEELQALQAAFTVREKAIHLRQAVELAATQEAPCWILNGFPSRREKEKASRRAGCLVPDLTPESEPVRVPINGGFLLMSTQCSSCMQHVQILPNRETPASSPSMGIILKNGGSYMEWTPFLNSFHSPWTEKWAWYILPSPCPLGATETQNSCCSTSEWSLGGPCPADNGNKPVPSKPLPCGSAGPLIHLERPVAGKATICPRSISASDQQEICIPAFPLSTFSSTFLLSA